MTSESVEAGQTGAPAAAAGGASARKSARPQAKAPAKVPAAKPRAGVPAWRTGKPDAFLAAAVDVAREAVATIAKESEIGAHIAAKSEGERVVTHLFESRLPGYGGWQWYAVVTRNSRSKTVTVSELGLLPSEDSILAPEWVPWAKRVRPEDEAQAPEHGSDGAESAEAESEEHDSEDVADGDVAAESDGNVTGDASGGEAAGEVAASDNDGDDNGEAEDAETGPDGETEAE
ncbi:DUF3027 domain-containing protein [Arthrobacter cupressi]|uniref:DUF3027 domain-containing protein n=1 Tax=Arthrobacter cupressi TaxID=1045773 RepID=A0A1G8HZ09_9MICC|nr:DUF3027 domain-containing protein [Arthrobacter cupressi]NYD78847.1 hypothetical protein [Arthrobacter cupressi]SDI11782.1 Protein of unknown function [Arthrobacter cupressi]